MSLSAKNISSSLTIAVALATYVVINSKVTIRAVIILGLLFANSSCTGAMPSSKTVMASLVFGVVLYTADYFLMKYVPEYRRIAQPLYDAMC